MSELIKNFKGNFCCTISTPDEVLIDEVRKDNVDNVCFLLSEACMNIDALSANGTPPLLYAIQNDSLAMVELLLEKGANTNKHSLAGVTPLLFAIQKGRLAMVRKLVKHGAHVNKQHAENGCTPLIIAAQNGHLDILKYLIKNGGDVNKSSNTGVTPLFISIKNEHNDIVIYLIEHGAKSNTPIRKSLSSTKITKEQNNPAIMSVLYNWKFNKIQRKPCNIPAGILKIKKHKFQYTESI